jgi:hypothetical protein
MFTVWVPHYSVRCMLDLRGVDAIVPLSKSSVERSGAAQFYEARLRPLRYWVPDWTSSLTKSARRAPNERIPTAEQRQG